MVAAGLVAQGVQLRLDSPDGPLIVRGASPFSSSSEGNRYHFKGSGQPVVIERPASGSTISANQVSADIEALADRNYVVRQGSFVGAARLVTDTEARDAFLKSAGKPVPKHDISDHTEIASERFDYVGTQLVGTVTAPGALTANDHSQGVRTVTRTINKAPVKGPEEFDQSWNLSAAKGELTVDPRPELKVQQRFLKGDLDGNVAMHLIRSVKGPGDLRAALTVLDGSADHLTFDFTGAARTITATGHVVLTNDDGVFKSTLSADKAVITVDENLKVTHLDTFGEPGTERVHRVGGVR